MSVRKAIFFIFCILPQMALLLAVDTPLTTQDVPVIMKKIFDYHVEYKSINPGVLQRSVKLYIDQFDPMREYLLQDEVAPYLNMNGADLNLFLQQYLKGDMTCYKELNKVIQKSIQRARQFTDELMQQPELLKWDLNASDLILSKQEFATSEDQLKERVRMHMVRYLHWHKQIAPFPYTRLKKALDLYKKKSGNYENSYLYLDEKGKALPVSEKENQLALNILKCLTASLDAHSTFFTPQEAYHLKVQLEKELYGVGIVLQESLEGVVITKLIPGAPAHSSGLIKPGDLLVEIDGKSLETLSMESALNLMRGKEHSTVALGIVRTETIDGQSKERRVNVQLKRSRVVMQEDRIEVSSEPFEDGIIGKITLYSFYEGTGGRTSEKDMRDALEKLYAQGNLKGLVLDFRANAGGFLSQAIKVAGLFITNGVVAIAKYSDGSIHYFRDLDGYVYYDGPMVILTSKASASAAEIVAQSLQDYGVALVVGDKRTYGKGSIQYQTVTDERSSSFFKVTVGRYYSVSGKSIQKEGVRANIIVPTQYYATDIGEKYLDYPLTADHMPPAFDDPLTDVDLFAYPWFMQYYLPTVQKPSRRWQNALPALQKNSAMRIAQDRGYQQFLKRYKDGMRGLLQQNEEITEEIDLKTDHAMKEAVKIVKEMAEIEASSKPVVKKNIAA